MFTGQKMYCLLVEKFDLVLDGDCDEKMVLSEDIEDDPKTNKNFSQT